MHSIVPHVVQVQARMLCPWGCGGWDKTRNAAAPSSGMLSFCKALGRCMYQTLWQNAAKTVGDNRHDRAPNAACLISQRL